MPSIIVINCDQLTCRDEVFIQFKLTDRLCIVFKETGSKWALTRNVSRGKNGYKLCENFLSRAATPHQFAPSKYNCLLKCLIHWLLSRPAPQFFSPKLPTWPDSFFVLKRSEDLVKTKHKKWKLKVINEECHTWGIFLSCNFCSEKRASAGKKRVVKILTKTEATRAFDEKIGWWNWENDTHHFLSPTA